MTVAVEGAEPMAETNTNTGPCLDEDGSQFDDHLQTQAITNGEVQELPLSSEKVEEKFSILRKASRNIAGIDAKQADSEGNGEAIRNEVPEQPGSSADHAAQVHSTGVDAARHAPASGNWWTRGDLLGDGAYGSVYKGLNHQNGSLFAVKQVNIETPSSRSAVTCLEALEAEIDLLKRLSHPNIVRYLGFERTEACMSIFLEYASGGSLAGILKRFRRLEEQTIRVYGLQILQGLRFLHEQGIVHRDIKCSNVLVDVSGACKLADFGCSKYLNNVVGSTKSFKGTIRFMAPEVIRGNSYGTPADIWSFGCTMLEMVSGKPPWSEFDAPEAALFQVGTRGASPSVPEQASEALRSLLEQCFRNSAEERATVDDLLGHPFFIIQATIPSSMPEPGSLRRLSVLSTDCEDTSQSQYFAQPSCATGVSHRSADEIASDDLSSGSGGGSGTNLSSHSALSALEAPELTRQRSESEFSRGSWHSHEWTQSPMNHDEGSSGEPSLRRVGSTGSVNSISGKSVSGAMPMLEEPTDFVGRDEDVKGILETLAQQVSTVRLAYVWGPGGVGKSCLAARICSVLARGSSAPDTNQPVDDQGTDEAYVLSKFASQIVGGSDTMVVQLDLKGTSDHPLSMNDAMDFVVRSCYAGMVSGPVHNDMEMRRLYFSCFASKHMVLVLDDAASALQVRALLPRGHATIIVTSRKNLGLEFEGGIPCYSLNLSPLSELAAVDLLQKIAPRVTGKTALDIAQLCGFLPLALRAIGATLARRPQMDPEEMCDLLRSSDSRRLQLVENCVRTSFACLDEAQRSRLIDLHVFPASFDARAASKVFREKQSITEDALAELLENSLLLFDTATNRYKLHDMVRLFCENEALSLSRDKRSKLHRRQMRHAMELVKQCEKRYAMATDAAVPQLRALLVLDRPNVEIALRRAHEAQNQDFLIRMARYGRQVFRLLLHPAARIELYKKCAMIAADQGDQRGEASMLSELGHCLTTLDMFSEGKICLRRSLAIMDKVAPADFDKAWGLSTLAWVLFSEARHHLAAGHENQAIHDRLCDEAEKLYTRALRAREQQQGTTDPQTGSVAFKLAQLYHHMDQQEAADRLYRQALESYRDAPKHPRVAAIYNGLGRLMYDRGLLEDSVDALLTALKIREEAFGSEHPSVRNVLSNLVPILQAQGRTSDAAAYGERIRRIDERIEADAEGSDQNAARHAREIASMLDGKKLRASAVLGKLAGMFRTKNSSAFRRRRSRRRSLSSFSRQQSDDSSETRRRSMGSDSDMSRLSEAETDATDGEEGGSNVVSNSPSEQVQQDSDRCILM